MKRKVILTESGFHRLMEGIITEDYGDGVLHESTVDGLEFEIPSYYEYEIAHFKNKLLSLKRKALSIGGDIDIDISTVKGKVVKNDGVHDVLVDVDFTHFKVTPSIPEIKMEGYKYIGSIVPLSISIDGEEKETIIVSLSKEFEGNDELRDELKKSSMHMTCDGCHRETSRGIYYCFLEEKTGKVLKLGSKCAEKYFGIDVGNKVYSLFYALSSLGNEPYVMYDPDGFPADKIRTPRTGSILDTMGTHEEEKFDNMVLRGCMAIAEYGPYCQMKTSMTHAMTLEDLMSNAASDCTSYSNGRKEFDYERYRIKIERLKEKYPELFEYRAKAIELSNIFTKEGAKFFYNMEPKSEFDEKIKNIGLLISGGRVQKKQIGKFSYLNFIPYCVSKFFMDKANNDPANAENKVKLLEPFSGTKEMDVTIDNVDKKQTRNGKDYYKVIALTSENEEVSWNMFKGEPKFKRGDKMRISATYNQTYKSLDNVKIVDVESDKPKENGEAVVNYPEDGTRYKNEDFEVKKLTQTYLVVKNLNDNCEYYISNVSEGFGYYDVTREKFDLSNISEGSVVKLTGTVSSYISQRTGKKGYKLLRVVGLPKSGKRWDDEY